MPRARAAELPRLERIGIVRFAPTEEGRLQLRQGVLDILGNVAWRGSQDIPRPENIPQWALHRTLVSVNAWLAYYALGGDALGNFEIQEGGVRAIIGDQAYLAVGVSPFAHYATGSLANLSTRSRLHGADDVVVAGFVIESRWRGVLVRVIGPGLARFGVPNAHPDPKLTIKRDQETIIDNDDWSSQPNADLIRSAAARVGAFPLAPDSSDAAQLIILPPGAYKVHASADRNHVLDGEVLIEIYPVPESVFD